MPWTSIVYVGMGLFGLFAALPQIVAVLQYIPDSVRTASYTAGENHLLLTDAVTFILPYFIKIPFFVNGLPGIYFGLPALALFFYALSFSRDRITTFFALGFLVMYFLALDVPPFSFVNEYAPLLSRFGTVSRWLLPGAFAFALVAACGYDALVSDIRSGFACRGTRRRFLHIVAIFSWFYAVVLIIISGLSSRLATDGVLRERLLESVAAHRSLTMPLSHYTSVFDRLISSLNQEFGWSTVGFSGLCAIVILTAIACLSAARGWKSTMLPAALMGLVVLTAFHAFAVENTGAFISTKQFYSDVPAAAEAILARESNPLSFRIVTYLAAEGFFQDISSRRYVSKQEAALFNRDYLFGESAAVYGLQTISGFDPFRTLRQNQLIETVINPQSLSVFKVDSLSEGVALDKHVNSAALMPVNTSEKLDSLYRQLPLLSMMNVKYIVSYFRLQDAQLVPVPLATSTEPEPYVYENSAVLPRLYFARSAIFEKGTDEQTLLSIISERDFAARTHIECMDCREHADSGMRRVNIISYTNGDMKAGTVGAGGWLVFSETAFPGWQATVDGKPVPIRSANYLFQAIFVPAGEHSIEFRYVNQLLNLYQFWAIH